MRIDHWYAHPTNRRLANRVGGAGTVIAAISAGLIAGVSAHPTENAVLASHRVSDAALDSTAPGHQPASTSATTQQVNAVPPAQVPPPALASPPASVAISGDHSDVHSDPASAPTSVPPTPPEQSGSTFQPYVHNGTTGPATQTTSGPSGTATITTTPTTTTTTTGRSEQRPAQHSSASTTPAGKSTKDTHHDSSAGGGHNSADHSSDHGADSERTQPDTHDDENQHSGPTAYSSTSPAGLVPQQGGGTTDSGSASRVAQALPPGFTPSQPRQSPPAATSFPAVSSPAPSLLPAVPPGSSSPGSTTDTNTAPTNTASTNAVPTSGISSGTQPGTRPGTQYQPAQSGAAQSATTSGPGAVASPVAAPVTALTPVACPAAVANATCYQQVPTPGSSAPGGGGTFVPSSPQGLTSSAPTVNQAPPAALPNTAAPAALPNTGPARVPASSPSRSVSSGDCQASGNDADSNVPAQGWDDFSAWIWDRVQDCINQGMARGGSGWNTDGSSSAGSGSATSTSSKPTKASPSAKGSAGSQRSKKDDD